MACTGTPGKKRKGKKKRHEEGKENKLHRNVGKKKEEKRSKHALRAQAEPQGDEVAVCWYDGSCDVSS